MPKLERTCARALLVVTAAVLAPTAGTGQSFADSGGAENVRGRWLLTAGTHRLFASFYADGTYNAVHEQDVRDKRKTVRSEWEVGRYVVSGDRVTLTQDPPTGGRARNCAEPFAGSYQFNVGGEGLTLRAQQGTLLLKPAGATARPETSDRTLFGCFERDRFLTSEQLATAPLFETWVLRRGSDVLELSLAPDGQGSATRERTTSDAKVQWQSANVTFTATSDALTLRMKGLLPCARQLLEGDFQWQRTGDELHLRQGRQTWTFTRRPPGPSPMRPAKLEPVGGCFDGDHFTAGRPPTAQGPKPKRGRENALTWTEEWNRQQTLHMIRMNMIRDSAINNQNFMRSLSR